MNNSSKLAALIISTTGVALMLSAAESQSLPWQREIPLREAAQSVVLQNKLNPTDPNGRPAMSINNLKMHTVLWGPPNQITISITKNNVWDRRLHEFQAPTLQEITEGAFSPANKDYVGVKEIDSSTFANVDILNLPSLAGKLTGKSDALSAVLNARLDDKTKASLAAYQTAKTNTYPLGRVLLTNIVADLNAVIDGPAIYDEKLFQNVRLRPDTETLLTSNPQGRDLVRLNRLLL